MIGELVGLPDWHLDAACRGADPGLFFPTLGESTREAKQICASCPVRVECLDFSFETDARFGIWGGLSERARRQIRADRRVA